MSLVWKTVAWLVWMMVEKLADCWVVKRVLSLAEKKVYCLAVYLDVKKVVVKVSMKVVSLALLMVGQMAVRLVCHWAAQMGL